MGASMATTARATEADLRNAPDDGGRYELVDGAVVRMRPAGARHGHVNIRLAARLEAYASAAGLGRVYDSSTGFRMPSGNVRSPDVSFVSAGRIDPEERGFAPVPPDLAVEVLSPSESPRHVADKVAEYLEAGVRLVWVIDPESRTAAAYRSLTRVRTVAERDALDGEDVLPGLRLPLAELFG